MILWLQTNETMILDHPPQSLVAILKFNMIIILVAEIPLILAKYYLHLLIAY